MPIPKVSFGSESKSRMERYRAVIETKVDLGGGRGGTMSVTEQ